MRLAIPSRLLDAATSRTLQRAVLAACAALAGASSCLCEPTPTLPDDETQAPVGTVHVESSAQGAVIVLDALEQPLRALQLDVDVNGSVATAFSAVGDFNVVDSNLQTPRASFRAVVADTRRLPMNDGPIAVVTLDAQATVTVHDVIAVDGDGARRSLTVVVP